MGKSNITFHIPQLYISLTVAQKLLAVKKSVKP